MKKGFWKSKTFWAATLTYVGAHFFPPVAEFMSKNPGLLDTLWPLLMVGMRLVSKDEVKVLPTE
jgi:hypothetical protein